MNRRTLPGLMEIFQWATAEQSVEKSSTEKGVRDSTSSSGLLRKKPALTPCRVA